jgi:hypothetical protein
MKKYLSILIVALFAGKLLSGQTAQHTDSCYKVIDGKVHKVTTTTSMSEAIPLPPGVTPRMASKGLNNEAPVLRVTSFGFDNRFPLSLPYGTAERLAYNHGNGKWEVAETLDITSAMKLNFLSLFATMVLIGTFLLCYLTYETQLSLRFYLLLSAPLAVFIWLFTALPCINSLYVDNDFPVTLWGFLDGMLNTLVSLMIFYSLAIVTVYKTKKVLRERSLRRKPQLQHMGGSMKN